LTFDYFKNIHGRNGIFGNGAGVPSRVHYGNNYVNAFWDGAQMTYGDGSGNAKPLVSIDVAGHEMSHGVTEALAGLVYSGESGGLNEATSDIFGNMVEFSANNTSDPGDYNVGEKIDINGNGTPLRYMYNPPLDGASHGCWSTSTQSVDVHYSSGVGNHFFFDLAEGTGATAWHLPVCGALAVVGIGRVKAEKIWYWPWMYFLSTRYVLTSRPTPPAPTRCPPPPTSTACAQWSTRPSKPPGPPSTSPAATPPAHPATTSPSPSTPPPARSTRAARSSRPCPPP
jgi:Zn-dependent metalloprotease